jgi:hypothetical protein
MLSYPHSALSLSDLRRTKKTLLLPLCILPPVLLLSAYSKQLDGSILAFARPYLSSRECSSRIGGENSAEQTQAMRVCVTDIGLVVNLSRTTVLVPMHARMLVPTKTPVLVLAVTHKTDDQPSCAQSVVSDF